MTTKPLSDAESLEILDNIDGVLGYAGFAVDQSPRNKIPSLKERLSTTYIERGVGEDCKLVPLEPTAEMLEVFADEGLTTEELILYRERYQDMLATSPIPQPAQESRGEEKWKQDAEELCSSADAMLRAANCLWWAHNPDAGFVQGPPPTLEDAQKIHSERFNSLRRSIYYMRKSMSAPPTDGGQSKEKPPASSGYNTNFVGLDEPASDDK